jgi:PGF-pre-PGF domain-containing protein
LVKSEFNKESNPVKYINITSKITTLDIRINVEVLKDTSTIVEKEPDGVVYKNLNIWVGYDGYATIENIINSTVEFKVDNNWIENNNIDPDSITLIHYNKDQKKWIELNTEKIKENDFDTYYIAHPSHFSPFAIIGHELSKGETKSENNNNNNNESGQSKVNDTPSGSENSKADINDSENLKSNGSSTDTNSTPNNNKANANDSNMVLDNSYLSFLILIAVIGILGAVLLVKRR